MDQIRVIPLGTSAGTPTSERNVASTALLLDGRLLLLDCGEGTQYRLIRSPVLHAGRLEAVLVTHLHGDHLYGLPGLLATVSMHDRSAPLLLAGPPGLEQFVRTILESSFLRLQFEVEFVDVALHGRIARRGYTIEAAPVEHGIPCYGYAVVEDDRPGRFDVDRARGLGVPEGPLFARLKAGEPVVLPDGRTVLSDEVVDPPSVGRRVAYCTDTVPCDGARRLARHADLLIHEATYGEEMAEEARLRRHSTARGAAEVARDAAAQRLLLTHFSPRYRDVAPLVEEARRLFPATDAAVELAEIELRLRQD